MAEILGFAASVAGLLTTAGAGFKLAESMLNMACRIHGAKEEIQDFGREIATFANVLLLAHKSLDPNREGGLSSSPALQWIQNHDALNNLVVDSQRTFGEIKKLKRPIRNMDSVIQIWTKIKWAWKSRDVRALGPKMESLKTSLNLVISIVGLEVALRKNDVKASKMTRKQMKLQLQTLEILEDRRQRAQPSYSSHVQESYSNPNSSETVNNVQELLVELGESMRQHGTVPDIVDDASSASSSSYAVQSSNSSFSHNSERYTSSKASVQLNDEPEERGSSSAFTTSQEVQSPVPESPTEIQHIDIRKQNNYQVESIRGNPIETERPKSPRRTKYPAETQKVSIQPNSAKQPSTRHNQVQKPLQEPSVKPPPPPSPLPPILTLTRDPDTGMNNADGFIISQNTQNTRRRTTAQLDYREVTAQLDFNLTHSIISRYLANHLNLTITSHPPIETIALRSNGQRYLSNSTVLFQWGNNRRDLKDAPLEIRCYVFDEGVEDMVFGRDFWELRKGLEYRKRIDL